MIIKTAFIVKKLVTLTVNILTLLRFLHSDELLHALLYIFSRSYEPLDIHN